MSLFPKPISSNVASDDWRYNNYKSLTSFPKSNYLRLWMEVLPITRSILMPVVLAENATYSDKPGVWHHHDVGPGNFDKYIQSVRGYSDMTNRPRMLWPEIHIPHVEFHMRNPGMLVHVGEIRTDDVDLSCTMFPALVNYSLGRSQTGIYSSYLKYLKTYAPGCSLSSMLNNLPEIDGGNLSFKKAQIRAPYGVIGNSLAFHVLYHCYGRDLIDHMPLLGGKRKDIYEQYNQLKMFMSPYKDQHDNVLSWDDMDGDFISSSYALENAFIRHYESLMLDKELRKTPFSGYKYHELSVTSPTQGVSLLKPKKKVLRPGPSMNPVLCTFDGKRLLVSEDVVGVLDLSYGNTVFAHDNGVAKTLAGSIDKRNYSVISRTELVSGRLPDTLVASDDNRRWRIKEVVKDIKSSRPPDHYIAGVRINRGAGVTGLEENFHHERYFTTQGGSDGVFDYVHLADTLSSLVAAFTIEDPKAVVTPPAAPSGLGKHTPVSRTFADGISLLMFLIIYMLIQKKGKDV